MPEILVGTVCSAQTEICKRAGCALAPYCEAIADREADLFLSRSTPGSQLTDETINAAIDLGSTADQIAKTENFDPKMLFLLILTRALRKKGHNTDGLIQ